MKYRRYIVVFILSLLSCTPALSYGTSCIRRTISYDTPLAAISLIYEDQYHNSVLLAEEVDYIAQAAPNIVDVFSIGHSYLGKEMRVLKITNETITRQKAKTLVVAQHHGREQITVEMALRFILYLVNNFGSNAQITKYLNSIEIFVIPTLNPDALDRVVNENDFWLRKNLHPYDNDYDGRYDEDPIDDANGDGWISSYDVYERLDENSNIYLYSYFEGIDDDGDGKFNEDEIGYVDLNRNYDAGWGGSGSSGDPTDQTYRGRKPFSEPETQAMRDFAEKHRFAMAFSLHSGINATYLPSDMNGYVEPDLYESVFQDFAEILPDSFITGGYTSLSQDGPIIEADHAGKWNDWMYVERNTPVPVCFEIFHDGRVDDASHYTIYSQNSTHVITEWHDIFGYFNPPANKIDFLWIRIRSAFTYLLDMIPQLDVKIESLPNTSDSPNDIRVDVEISCLAPRIGTVDPIFVQTFDNETVHSWSAIDAGDTLHDQLILTLPFDASIEPVTLFVGNNYTGFYPVIIEKSDLTTITEVSSTSSNTITESTSITDSPIDISYILIATSFGLVIIVAILIVRIRK